MTDLFACTNWADAKVSSCGKYRYELTRGWDSSKPSVCWCLLNPSTADATADDPTIRRIVNFSLAWGAGSIVVVNLFALRSTDPKQLRGAIDPVGIENDLAIVTAAMTSDRVIAAWGAWGGLRDRDRAVKYLLRNRRVECMGLTGGAHPRHPLYLPCDAVPMEFMTPEAKRE